MLLMDINTSDVRKFKVKSGATVIRMPAEEFSGEYKQTGPFYLLMLWLVSFWAMITNLAQAIFIIGARGIYCGFVKLVHFIVFNVNELF